MFQGLRLSAARFALRECSSIKLGNFNNAAPEFRIEEYFLGQTRAWGVFEDRFGKLRRQFTVDVTGAREGDVITLDEHFEYADGGQDRRVWEITIVGDRRYEGRANDVVGVAKGAAKGNVLNWAYDLNLKVGGRAVQVRFDDWMFLQPDGVLINRAAVSKFGIEIGQVTLTFKKVDGAVSTPPLTGLKPPPQHAQ